MKKVFYSILLCLGIISLTSCGRSDKDYIEACNARDFETAHKILNQYREDYTEALSEDLDKSYRRKKYDAAQQEYYKAFDYIYQHEVQLIMAEATEEECEGKITFILQSIPVEGEKNERGGWNFDSMKRFKAYLIWSQHYNSLCNNIFALAINRKNQELARFILMQFVDEIFIDGNNRYVKYRSIERNKAEQKYQEAVNLGMFED
jgi:hypothetical protein